MLGLFGSDSVAAAGAQSSPLTSELVAEASLALEVGVGAKVAASRDLHERAASAEPVLLPAAGETCAFAKAINCCVCVWGCCCLLSCDGPAGPIPAHT